MLRSPRGTDAEHPPAAAPTDALKGLDTPSASLSAAPSLFGPGSERLRTRLLLFSSPSLSLRSPLSLSSSPSLSLRWPLSLSSSPSFSLRAPHSILWSPLPACRGHTGFSPRLHSDPHRLPGRRPDPQPGAEHRPGPLAVGADRRMATSAARGWSACPRGAPVPEVGCST